MDEHEWETPPRDELLAGMLKPVAWRANATGIWMNNELVGYHEVAREMLRLAEENRDLREVRDLFTRGPEALEKAILARVRLELGDFLARLTIKETAVAQYLRNPARLPAAMDQRDIDDLLDRICPKKE